MKPGFKVRDLIWARVKNHPAWPARIEPQPEQGAKKGHVYVYYFGAKSDEQYGWIPNASITKYDNETKAKLSRASTRADFKLGIELIEAEYKKMVGSSSVSEGDAESESEKGDAAEETKSEPTKRIRRPKKKFGIESGESSVTTPKLLGGNKRKSSGPDLVENGTKHYKATYVSDSMKDDYTFTTSEDAIEKPDLNSVDFSTIPEVAASTYTIGFLGLGVMSTGMVNNLIKSGHKVNLWSRDNDKCAKLKEKADNVKQGRVTVCMTPWDVMNESNIVFNCSSDPEAAKKNVLGNCGVTTADNLDGKGYVEMTGIDPHTSLKICEAIQSKGGRYLEAQLQGSRDEAADGTLVVLTAGDNSLFMDCQSCFKAIAKSSLYLGEVGVATKVYLILQLMQGISLVGLAEGLMLADRCGISGKDVVNIFNMTSMSSPYLRKKSSKIVNKDFKEVELSIKNMQKDIRLALGLSDDLMQPLMMGSAANEVFKHSRKLGYDEHDCSCIYMKARY